MVRGVDAATRVIEIAEGQWGLFTSAQARRAHVSYQNLAFLTEIEVLERIDFGVYGLADRLPHDAERFRAAWLMLDRAASVSERLVNPVAAGVASHLTAAHLHQLGSPQLDLSEHEPVFTVAQITSKPRDIALHQGDLSPTDVVLVAGLPVTTPEHTLVDLLQADHELEIVAKLAGRGIQREVIDRDRLAEALNPLAAQYRKRNGAVLADHLLGQVGLSAADMARAAVRSALRKSES